MGIIDKLFGTDDPIDKEVEKNLGKDKVDEDIEEEDWPPHNVLYGEKKWPYEIEPDRSEKMAGREIYTVGEDGEMYAGKDIRDMIENRRYDKEGPTRIGYTKDNVKGIQDIYIDHEALFRHIVLFGQTGYGKSTLMRNIMLQWINAGHGVCYIDPKGDDSYELLQQIPPHRIDDVVWVEPGADREKMVGFNVFDTASEPGDPRYQKEVGSVTNDFLTIMEDRSNYWGPRIENITKTVMSQLIKSDDKFNPIDMVKFLLEKDERQRFVENYGDEDIEQVFLKQVADQDDDKFEPIIRRVREWVVNPTTRQVMSHKESKITIQEAINEGKLLIINTNSIQERDATSLITRLVISRVWSAIQARKAKIRGKDDMDETDLEPYYLCIDEFDKVVGSDFDVNRIISQARSFRLSVFVANQQPSQLEESVQHALKQVDSLMSFNPGENHRDKQVVASSLGDVETFEISELPEYKIVGRPYMDGSQRPGMLINTFGEYPPLRTEEEAQQIVERSLDNYGTKSDIELEYEDAGVDRFIDEKDTGYEINNSGDTITQQQLFECIYTAKLRNETKEFGEHDDWISIDQLREEVEKYSGSVANDYVSRLSNIMEEFTDREVQRTVSDKAYFRLGNAGLKKAFEQDTGVAASGGKSAHRVLLRKGHEAFTKLGYDVSLPTQDGGQMPDGLADPPINPMKESTNFEEAVQKEKELVKKYPRLAQLFGDSEIAIEAESTTISRPAQTIKNFIKALKENKHCVFLVKDGSEKKNQFEYWAKAGEAILTDPPFVRGADSNGNRTFYNTGKKITLSNDARALVPKDAGETTWREYGKEKKDAEDDEIHVQLVGTNESEPLAEFRDSSKLLRKPRPSKFPYHYYRDTQSNKTIVKDNEGKVVEKYENMDEMRKDGKFKSVKQPIIPEYELPEGKYPDPSSWTFIIIPSDNREGPKIYDNGDIKPLLPEDGAKIDPKDFKDMHIDIDVETLIPEKMLDRKKYESPFASDADDESSTDGNNDGDNDDDESSTDGVDTLPDTTESQDDNPLTDVELDNEPEIPDSSIDDDDDNDDDEDSTDLTDIPQFPDDPNN